MPNIIQPLQSDVQSAATVVATAIPSVVSQVHSGAIALSTAIPDSIEALIPQYLSLGTKKFCMGFAQNATPSCSELPLNFSTHIPTKVEEFFRIDSNDIGYVTSALLKITTVVYDCLLCGLVLVLAIIVISGSLSFPTVCLSNIPGLKILRAGVPLLLGIISCTFLTINLVILRFLDTKTKQFPSWIQVENGEVNTKLSLWSLICAIIAMVVSTLSPFVL